MTDYRYAFEQPGRFARGWHIALFSQELAVGEAKPLHYFNQELVAYRGEDRRVVILDAYCPHLGAHLGGTGATVIGNNIRCPFHGWQFDSSGACVDIPYAKTIPERALTALNSWPVLEVNGCIAVWHDHEGGQPDWELPAIEDWGNWGEWQFNRSRIRAHGREVIENIVDIGHFPFVHGGQVKSWENEFTELTVSQRSSIKRDPNASMIVPEKYKELIVSASQSATERDEDQEGVATYHGPAVMYFYTQNRSEFFSFESWWMNFYTPVNNDEIDLTSGVVVRSLDEQALPDEFLQMYPQVAHAAFGQDVEIWETKLYRADPILCDGDGPINKLRKWYDRFYQPR